MDFLKELNRQQKQAVMHTKGPLLVIAGAGTGKTKVITRRISQLIRKGVSADKILAVTFTNKAAEEMKSRVADLTGIKPRKNFGPTIGTFHAIGADILRSHGKEIGIPYFSIIDESDALEIIKLNIEEIGLNQKQFKPAHIQNLISNQRASSIPGFESKPTGREEFFQKNLGLIAEKYRETLALRNTLDFDDIIQKTIFLFGQKPEILRIYQEKWPYIHIDEYQDTDSSQARVIELLGQRYGNICAVGDEDQSIYGFRGADFKNILDFEKKWPETKIATLERNYRSTQKILDAANAVIIKNNMRRPKNLYTKNKKGSEVSIFEAENEKKEATFVANHIENLIKSSNPSIAILCRANYQFPAFEEELRNSNIPYQTAANQDSLSAEQKPVRLMTVHAAKGLEFQYVFVPGLEKGLFPCVPTEEERRLFYVALTRAQEKVFLSWTRFRSVFGYKQINQPSPYLSDIPRKAGPCR